MALPQKLREIFNKKWDNIKDEELKTLEANGDYARSLFQCLSGDNGDDKLKFICSVAMKNFIKKHWMIKRFGAELSKIPESHRCEIKANIFDVLEKSSPIIQRQIIEMIVIISKREFPFKWPKVIDEIERQLKCNGLPHVWTLKIAEIIFKRYRFELASDLLWREINFVVEKLTVPLTKKFEALAIELTHESHADLMILFIDIFRSLTTQDLPEKIEENLSTWMFGFRRLLNIDQQVVPTKKVQLVWSNVFETLILFGEKYEEELEPFLEQFLDETLVDTLAPGFLRFYAVIAKRKRFHHIFASKVVLGRIFHRAILPNIVFLASTKQLNNDPDEYIRIDMCEQGVSCLIETLVENYECFSEIIGQQVERYIENTTKNVLSKRSAIFLATFQNKCKIQTFCAEHIVAELSNTDDLLVVRLDAIKFLIKFGSKEILQNCLPCLEQCSRSINKVESLYALWTLKKWNKMLHSREILWKVICAALKQRDISSPYLVQCSFEDLNIDNDFRVGLASMGISAPTRFQELVIPKLIANPHTNYSLIATQGTGKTLAYLLPILKKIDTSKDFTQAICLVFSCELAYQTADMAARLAIFLQKPIQIGLAISTKKDFMIRFNHYHIIIGTPKEMVAFRELNVFDLNKLHSAVFDDADLVASSRAVKSNIINPMPASCQQIYVSSVKLRPQSSQQVEIKLFINDSVYPQNNDNFFIRLQNDNEKYRIIRALTKKVSTVARAQMLIFFTKKAVAERYAEMLNNDGLSVALLTGSLPTEKRLDTFINVCYGTHKVLIATDFISRRINISNMKIVVNFDLPFNSDVEPSYKVYLHRSGRTGRFGKHGIIVTLIDSQQSFEAYKKISENFHFELQQLFC